MSKVRPLLTITFWRTKGIAIVRKFFARLFNVKPKNKEDYYSIFRWYISKRLAYALVILIGVASLYYVLVMSPVAVFGHSSGNKSLPIYKYNSLAIRFFEGDCRIKARDGHIAYEGAVEKGEVKGEGRLLGRGGELIYDGSFDKNLFNGDGRLYYDGGELKYEGAFRNNLFNGEGKLYSESGSIIYDGEFLKNMKNGAGTLYNAASTAIFKGNFVLDHIPYDEFVGKTAQESAEMYTGNQSIYAYDEEFAISFDEIGAVATMTNAANDIEGESKISSLTVMQSEFFLGGKSYKNIDELNKYFGTPDYAGYTYCLLTDVVAINSLKGDSPIAGVDIETQDLFDGVYQVIDYDHNVEVYIYAYKYNGAMYTFYCGGSGEKEFLMYQVEVGE
jgi:antitoxin component YwqK of YwqJK toxin-antitoxin module